MYSIRSTSGWLPGAVGLGAVEQTLQQPDASRAVRVLGHLAQGDELVVAQQLQHVARGQHLTSSGSCGFSVVVACAPAVSVFSGLGVLQSFFCLKWRCAVLLLY